ncbi:hypothetical protein SUGI_0995830 [Cryptomeria japonica]|uniref:uncharacterized protein LOC131060664 n=1 Tax=Cryptomeria japonica TaxID=3369 RepID=UPI0024147478|nr:uncharacterized protein LOC131060664 [Cryptomeria japonica]XP_057849964.1 uncharacterized protein LOC131060664 [Cryptomeria japonica]GLJ47172.1 hypothetical protein SUGI_0995830 [Cryptomeria japonica]
MESGKNSANPKPKTRSRVSQERVEKAVGSLLKWVKSRAQDKKPQHVEHDELLYMVATLKKVSDDARKNPYRIPLCHPLFPLDGSQEICLLVNDKEKGMNADFARRKLKEEGLPISNVLKYSKLRTHYHSFEARKKLFESFDIFMADKSVIPLLPKALGKGFFKKKKNPIPVDLSHKQWRAELELACGSAFLNFGKGTCCFGKIARVSQTRQEIVENVVGFIDGLASVIPKKWGNIRALHLKSLESLALPLYQSVPDNGFRTGDEKIESQVLTDKSEEKGIHARVSDKDLEKKPLKKERIHNAHLIEHTLGDLCGED